MHGVTHLGIVERGLVHDRTRQHAFIILFVIAPRQIKDAEPDGYTVGVWHSGLLTAAAGAAMASMRRAGGDRIRAGAFLDDGRTPLDTVAASTVGGGIHLDEADALAFLARQPATFDGLYCSHFVEHLPFEEVTYWDELRRVFDWTQSHVQSTFGVCWGGMAMAYHFHGVQKHALSEKAFGCFRQTNLAPASPYLRGFSDDLLMPVSRWTEMREEELTAAGLKPLLSSEETGACLVEDPDHRALYIFNHFEYDSDTLKQEYDRDVASGTPIEVPANYYPDDDPSKRPLNRWRSHAHLLYGNWVNEIYQATPYDIMEIGK